MLNFFRKLFGCYHDNSLDIVENNIQNLDAGNTITIAEPKDEKTEIISQVISKVIEKKEKSFISYTEEAQDLVTNNKFKFLPYRNIE